MKSKEKTEKKIDPEIGEIIQRVNSVSRAEDDGGAWLLPAEDWSGVEKLWEWDAWAEAKGGWGRVVADAWAIREAEEDRKRENRMAFTESIFDGICLGELRRRILVAAWERRDPRSEQEGRTKAYVIANYK